MNTGIPFSNKTQNAQEFYNKGVALYLENKHQQAVDMLENAAELDPNHHEALGLLGQITRENGYVEESIECYALAIHANNSHTPYKQAFLDLIAYHPVIGFNQAMKDIILGCLITDDIDLSAARIPWFGLLKQDPDFKPFLKLMDKSSFEEFKKSFSALDNTNILTDPYFLTGLQKLIVFKAEFERFLTNLRHFFLCEAHSDKNPLREAQMLMLLASLSCYCHETEYVLARSDDEEQKIAAIQKSIVSGTASDMEIALYACYAPLSSLENAPTLAADYSAHPALADIVALQITNIAARDKIKNSIPALTPIKNEVSEKVRAQYETFPYPRWKTYDQNIKNEHCESFLSIGNPRILVAGCGTGKEAIELGHVFPDAHILAVDLSLSSLSYGVEQARKFGINNVRFEHADILELGALPDRFDYIASSGVLHHMDAPENGLKVLTGLLKSGGTMRLAFYSRFARHAINKTRTAINEHKIGNDDQSIRDFRAGIKNYIDKKTYENISSFADYYSMSECRDLIFHVQEHQYDLQGIEELLAQNNLAFKEFYLPKSTLEKYSKMFPQDVSKTNLTHWKKFEERHQDSFKEMYRFWCIKE